MFEQVSPEDGLTTRITREITGRSVLSIPTDLRTVPLGKLSKTCFVVVMKP